MILSSKVVTVTHVMPHKVSPEDLNDDFSRHEKLVEIRKRRNVVVFER